MTLTGHRVGCPTAEDLGEGPGEPDDLGRGRHLGRADEQSVGEGRVGGLGVGEDQPGQDPVAEQPAMDGRERPGRGRELVEVRTGVEPRHADGGQCRLELGGPAPPSAATSRRPCGPMVAR